jgi:methylated-DNA-protein-cysteine methyltransferase-like protein
MEQSFYDQVFELARLIPKGRVTSYGAIAKSLGAGGSARMVMPWLMLVLPIGRFLHTG